MQKTGPAGLFDQLQASRASHGRNAPVVGPGVYALFAHRPHCLPGLGLPETGLVYIGQSGRISGRDHFTMKTGGFSTLRRSLGAILKDSLRLTAVPRGLGAAKSNVTNYRFTDSGEQRLSEWMAANLDLAALADSKPKALEKQLIRHCEPPLCLRGWPNPQAQKIRHLRHLCRDEAARSPIRRMD